MTKTAIGPARPVRVAALFALFALAWLAPREASAQLGQVIVTITSPAPGSTVGGTSPVNATVTIIGGLIVQGVQFKLDGANLGAEDTSQPYSVSWDTKTSSNGSHTLTAVARAPLNVLWPSDPVAVTVFNDVTPPTVAVTSPALGAMLRGTITVQANASDNVGVVGVQFRLDGANLGPEDTSAPYSVPWNTTTASDGSHTVAAVARDAAGNTATSVGVTVTGDNAVPAAAVTAPGNGARVSGTTVVTANATDNIGVAGVRFFLDGAALGAEDTSAPFAAAWDTTAVASGSHTLTAVARDGAGNTSSSAPPVGVTVTQTATRLENTELSITYVDGDPVGSQPPGWWHGSRSREWSGAISSFNRADGGRATFSFQGSTVRWIGFRAPWAGIARVYMDDVFVQELDLYQTTEATQAVVFSRTGLGPGNHTLAVEATGRKNAAASDYAVVVDAFDVAPPSPPPSTGARVEETAMSLDQGWSAAEATTRVWSGGSAVVSETPGAQATFGFIGTEVRWVGVRGPQNGIARVYLDGAFQAQVDTYAPAEVETVVYVATTLAPGRHTMAIEATGTKNPAATASLVVVDAADVRSRIEDPDPSIAYTTGWRGEGISKAWSGSSPNTGSGTTMFTRTGGEQATISFTGTSVSWIGYRAPWAGTARVSVDGGFVADVDTFAPAEQAQAVVFTASGLTEGAHTLTVEVTGQRNPSAIDSLVVVDAFDVGLSPSAPSITRVQETNAAVTYTGPWTPGTGFKFWSGQTVALSGTAGAQASFTFTGTAVRWIGDRSFNGGIARVLLDGVEVAQVDTFAPVQEEYQGVRYSVAGLTDGTHTLTIEATGLKNPSAFNAFIFVDAFDTH